MRALGGGGRSWRDKRSALGVEGEGQGLPDLPRDRFSPKERGLGGTGLPSFGGGRGVRGKGC